MGLELTKKYETRLETAIENDADIPALLDAKVAHYQEKGLAVEESVADYIFLGIQGQKDKIAQYKQYKKDLDAAIKEMELLEKETESKVFEWMETNGLEKLNGISCSSITTKPSAVSITNRIVRDISDAELLEKGFAHKEETIKDTPQGLRINKRKAS